MPDINAAVVYYLHADQAIESNSSNSIDHLEGVLMGILNGLNEEFDLVQLDKTGKTEYTLDNLLSKIMPHLQHKIPARDIIMLQGLIKTCRSPASNLTQIQTTIEQVSRWLKDKIEQLQLQTSLTISPVTGTVPTNDIKAATSQFQRRAPAPIVLTNAPTAPSPVITASLPKANSAPQKNPTQEAIDSYKRVVEREFPNGNQLFIEDVEQILDDVLKAFVNEFRLMNYVTTIEPTYLPPYVISILDEQLKHGHITDIDATVLERLTRLNRAVRNGVSPDEKEIIIKDISALKNISALRAVKLTNALRQETQVLPQESPVELTSSQNSSDKAIGAYRKLQQLEIPTFKTISISLDDSQATKVEKQQKFLDSKQQFQEIIYLFWEGLHQEFVSVTPTNQAFLVDINPSRRMIEEILPLGVESSLHILKSNKAIDDQTFNLLKYIDKQFKRIDNLKPHEMELFVSSLEELKSLAVSRAHALQAPEATSVATTSQPSQTASTRTSNESTGIFGRFFSAAGEVLGKLGFGASLGLAVGLILMASGVFAPVGATLLLAMAIGAGVTLVVTEVHAYRQEKRMGKMAGEVMRKNPTRVEFEREESDDEENDVDFYSTKNDEPHRHLSTYAQLASLNIGSVAAETTAMAKEDIEEVQPSIPSDTPPSSEASSSYSTSAGPKRR